MAELTLDALEGRSVALMASHGTIAHGADLDAAVRDSRLLEWACTVYWRAATIGTPRVLDSAQQRAVVDTAAQRRYGTTHRVDQTPMLENDPRRSDPDDS